MKNLLFAIILVLLVNLVSGQTKIRLSQIEDIQGTVIKSTGETSGKVLTANGSGLSTWQTPLNGGVANYVAKWTGSSTLGYGLIYDNGTNIGIGTTTPNSKLTVNDNITMDIPLDATSRLIKLSRLGNNVAGGAILLRGNSSTTDRYLQLGMTDNTGAFTPDITILDNGNIGIGTASPTEKINVIGKIIHSDGTASNHSATVGQLNNAIASLIIPTNTNQLTNGAGFITDGNSGWDNSYGYITDGNTGWDNSYGFITSYTETDPNVYSWAKAATKPTYTAGEVGAQPAATVLTNTTASFTTAQETKLSGIATGAEVNVNADWNSVSGDSQILNKPTIPTNTNQLTNGSGFITDGNTGWDNSYGFITSEVDGSISNEGVIGVTSSGISKSVLLSTTTSGASGTVFTAGAGMTISGAYQSDGGSITYNLGTGGSITPTSTNSVSGNTHTHQISIYGTPSDGNTLKYSSTYGFSWGSSVDGIGSSDRLALWTGTNTQSSDADFTYNSTNNTLSIGSGSGNGYVTSGNFVNSSDRRLKERIRKMENLKWVDEIEFKNFEFKGDINDRLRYGVIAQEVEKINPELVYTDENNYRAVGYIDLLVAKVARQDEIINELLKRIEKLERDEK